MKKHDHARLANIGYKTARITGVCVIGIVLLFQLYAFVMRQEGRLPLPPQFGNFPSNRAILEQQVEKDKFAFAVVGDTKSHGTFERIAEELRATPLDFAVLLGDCSYDGTQEAHRYFRAEAAQEYALPFPVFYVVGNHDISPEDFPISRFEKEYGPSIFSFEYQHCLFIVLRILNPPFTNEESIAFLKKLRDVPEEQYRHKFAFMHIPPPVSSFFSARSFREHKQLVRLFDEIGVDYVFGGDFHGFAHVRLRETTYVITGGGGAHLNKHNKQFHHAFVVQVDQGTISERIVPVDGDRDVEDILESFAISKAWPWMTRNVHFVYALNMACSVLLFILLKPAVVVRAFKRQRGF